MRHRAAACRLDGRAMAVRHSCLALMSSPGQSVLAVYGAVVSELGLRPQPLTCCLLLFRSWTSATAAAKRAPQQLIYTVLAFGALWLQARLRNLQCRMPPAYACAGAALLLHWWPARQAAATCAFLVIPLIIFSECWQVESREAAAEAAANLQPSSHDISKIY